MGNKKLTEHLLAQLRPSNLVTKICYLIGQRCIHKLCKINIKKGNICHLIPVQTLSFLTAWPTQQDGVENLDKAYYNHWKILWNFTEEFHTTKFSVEFAFSVNAQITHLNLSYLQVDDH